MKVVKIILSVIVLAGLLYGIYHLKTASEVTPISVNGKSPTNPKVLDIEKRIQEDISQCPSNRFCNQKYDEIRAAIDLYFNKPGSVKESDMNYCIEKLNGEYAKKFVEQANFVFGKKGWNGNNIGFIRSEYRKLASVFPKSQPLVSISNVIVDYDRLALYDAKVKALSCRKGYGKAHWDKTSVVNLISNPPTIVTKAKNSSLYDRTRRNEVRQTLYVAHRKFLQSFIDYYRVNRFSNTDEWLDENDSYRAELDVFKSMASDYGECTEYGDPYNEVTDFCSSCNYKFRELKP